MSWQGFWKVISNSKFPSTLCSFMAVRDIFSPLQRCAKVLFDLPRIINHSNLSSQLFFFLCQWRREDKALSIWWLLRRLNPIKGNFTKGLPVQGSFQRYSCASEDCSRWGKVSSSVGVYGPLFLWGCFWTALLTMSRQARKTAGQKFSHHRHTGWEEDCMRQDKWCPHGLMLKPAEDLEQCDTHFLNFTF